MLLVTRKVGEKISIGPQSEILLTIVGIKGGQARVGIEADASIIVRRGTSLVRCGTSELATVPQEHQASREISHDLELAQ
jgi:carbon storage regulator CsrA